MKSSLEHKTVRPGSLTNYSFYYSNRTPASSNAKVPVAAPRRWRLMLLVVAVITVAGGYSVISKHQASQPVATKQPARHAVTKQPATPKPAPAVVAPAVTNCTGNALPYFVKVSVSQRHMWACQGANQVYESPVITGMENLVADLTPRGTYHVYGKYTNLTLRGSDTTGSWNDPVSYWMPFLQNQYGIYGFHDATWRDNSEFGNVDPNSSNASHGCVELPLSTAKWLYSWAPIHTTVTIVD